MKTVKYYLVVLICLAFGFAQAQHHTIGEVLNAPDGTPGVVFYISPDGNSYWLAAMNDLPGTYQWGPYGDIPELLNYVASSDTVWYALHYERCGYDASQIMYQSQGGNANYAAAHVDLQHGWHIPSTGQLSKLYAALPYVNHVFAQNGGCRMSYSYYWASTESTAQEAWAVGFDDASYYGGLLKDHDKLSRLPVRPVWSLSCEVIDEPPTVGAIFAPDGICSGESLNLTSPETQYAFSEGWQMAQDIGFANYQDYDGEALDSSYNGWFIRYFASNEVGITYSNLVQITIWHDYATAFSISSCEPYEWNGQIYTQTGDYEQTFSSVHGCDSLVTLHLAIDSINHLNIIERGCDSVVVNGIAYYESGEYEQLRPGGEMGCDTIVTLYLTVNHLPNISDIQGRSRIYVDEFGIFDYCIDPVPEAIAYEWSVDNPTWALETSMDSPCCHLDVRTTSTGTLRVKVFTECGFIERTLFISHQEMPGFVVFPVPTKGDVTIAIYGLQGENIIEIFDEIGRLVDRISIDAIREGITIPYTLRDKAAGVYLFKVVGNYYCRARKVVKY